MPTGSLIQSNVPRNIKFLPLETYFLNLLWRNSYPSVDWDQRTLQKSHSKWEGKQQMTSSHSAVLAMHHPHHWAPPCVPEVLGKSILKHTIQLIWKGHWAMQAGLSSCLVPTKLSGFQIFSYPQGIFLLCVKITTNPTVFTHNTKNIRD